MDHTQYLENEGVAAEGPHFLYIHYGASVACTVGSTWLMYSLCMAQIWPMYDLYMAYIAVCLYMPSLVYFRVVGVTRMIDPKIGRKIVKDWFIK